MKLCDEAASRWRKAAHLIARLLKRVVERDAG
jgi:hypothetical protein